MTLINSFFDMARNIPSGQLFNTASDLVETGVRVSKKHGTGLLWGLAAANLGTAVGVARPGHMASRATGVIGGELGGWAGATLGMAIGGPIGSFVGSAIGYELGQTALGTSLYKGMQLAKQANHLNVGGNYTDTEVAWTMRQRASQELSGSLLNARTYLGKEGRLLHS